jgi:hypothetical protein
LGEESSRYWHVIQNRTYQFKRLQIIADHVKNLKKDNALRFYDKYIAMNAPHRRKLCVQVVAKQHDKAAVLDEEDDEQRGKIDEDAVDALIAPITTMTQEALVASELANGGSADVDDDCPAPTTGGTDGDVNVNNSSRTIIEDAAEFKRSMPLFQMPATVVVDVVDFGLQKQ